MSWNVRHVSRTGTITDITPYVTSEALGVSASASPSGSTFPITMVGEGFEAQIGARVEIRDGSTVMVRGWVESIDRGDTGPVAGLSQQTTLYCADIFAILRRTYVPQVDDISSQAAYDQERPAGFREKVQAYDPDPAGTLNLTKPQMYAWALELIESLEAAKGASRIPAIGTGTGSVSNYPTFTFDNFFPIVADGQSYWNLIDGIAQLSGQGWTIEPSGSSMVLRTWDLTAVQNENIADFELSDDPDVAPHTGGHSVIAASTISLTEDASGVVNKVQVVWSSKSSTGRSTIKTIDLPGEGLTTGVFDTTDSVAAYGVRFERMTSDFTSKAKAIAIASRKIGSSKTANNRGSARIPYTGTVTPGRWVWVHRVNHPGDHAGHWDGLAWLQSVTPVFERGADGPVWQDLEFTRDTYEPSAFRPFVPAEKPAVPLIDADTGTPGTTPTETPPTGPPLINPVPTTAPLPPSGEIFLAPISTLWSGYGYPPLYVGSTVLPGSSTPVTPGYVSSSGGTDVLPGDTARFIPEYRNDALGEVIGGSYRPMVMGVFPNVPASMTVDTGRLFIAISVAGPNDYQATRIRIGQCDPINSHQSSASNLTPAVSNWAVIDKGLKANGKEFTLAPGVNRIEIPFNLKKHSVPASFMNANRINGYQTAFFAAIVVGQKGPKGALQGISNCSVTLGSGASVGGSDIGAPWGPAPHIGATTSTLAAGSAYRVKRADPTKAYSGLTGTAEVGLTINISKRQVTTAHCYALIGVEKSASWTNTASSEVTEKLAGARGKVLFTLGQVAKPASVSVYLCDGRYSFAVGSPGTRDISRRVVLQKNSAGKVTGFDITPIQSYGLVPKQFVMAVYVPAA